MLFRIFVFIFLDMNNLANSPPKKENISQIHSRKTRKRQTKQHWAQVIFVYNKMECKITIINNKMEKFQISKFPKKISKATKAVIPATSFKKFTTVPIFVIKFLKTSHGCKLQGKGWQLQNKILEEWEVLTWNEIYMPSVGLNPFSHKQLVISSGFSLNELALQTLNL